MRPWMFFLLIVSAAPALAAPTSSDAGIQRVPIVPAMLKPGHLDARFSADTDIFLLYVSLGAAVDLGIAPVGTGTVSLGASFEFGFCGSFCLGMSTFLTGTLGRPTAYGQQFYYPHARLSYHLNLSRIVEGSAKRGSRSTLEKLDVYGLLSGGPMFTHLGVSTPDQSIVITGDDVSWSLGGGLGGAYFFTERVFLAAEAVVRYAQGRYIWHVQAGNFALDETQATWLVAGFNLRFSIGVRL